MPQLLIDKPANLQVSAPKFQLVSSDFRALELDNARDLLAATVSLCKYRHQ
jgi:hypothetical protein